MPPIPFKHANMEHMMNPYNIKKTKIGILDYSTFLGVSDSVKRAMKMTKDALEKIGYKTVPIKLPQSFYDDVRDTYMAMSGNSELRWVF